MDLRPSSFTLSPSSSSPGSSSTGSNTEGASSGLPPSSNRARSPAHRIYPRGASMTALLRSRTEGGAGPSAPQENIPSKGIADLPPELLGRIAQYLEPHDLFPLALGNKGIRDALDKQRRAAIIVANMARSVQTFNDFEERLGEIETIPASMRGAPLTALGRRIGKLPVDEQRAAIDAFIARIDKEPKLMRGTPLVAFGSSIVGLAVNHRQAAIDTFISIANVINEDTRRLPSREKPEEPAGAVPFAKRTVYILMDELVEAARRGPASLAEREERAVDVIGPARIAVEQGENVLAVLESYGLTTWAAIHELEARAYKHAEHAITESFGKKPDFGLEDVKAIAHRYGISDLKLISILLWKAAKFAIDEGSNVHVPTVAEMYGLTTPAYLAHRLATSDPISDLEYYVYNTRASEEIANDHSLENVNAIAQRYGFSTPTYVTKLKLRAATLAVVDSEKKVSEALELYGLVDDRDARYQLEQTAIGSHGRERIRRGDAEVDPVDEVGLSTPAYVEQVIADLGISSRLGIAQLTTYAAQGALRRGQPMREVALQYRLTDGRALDDLSMFIYRTRAVSRMNDEKAAVSWNTEAGPKYVKDLAEELGVSDTRCFRQMTRDAYFNAQRIYQMPPGEADKLYYGNDG